MLQSYIQDKRYIPAYYFQTRSAVLHPVARRVYFPNVAYRSVGPTRDLGDSGAAVVQRASAKA
jgi:hypothetical protein